MGCNTVKHENSFNAQNPTELSSYLSVDASLIIDLVNKYNFDYDVSLMLFPVEISNVTGNDKTFDTHHRSSSKERKNRVLSNIKSKFKEKYFDSFRSRKKFLILKEAKPLTCDIKQIKNDEGLKFLILLFYHLFLEELAPFCYGNNINNLDEIKKNLEKLFEKVTLFEQDQSVNLNKKLDFLKELQLEMSDIISLIHY